MIPAERYFFVRMIALLLLLACSYWFYSSAWRLPLGEVSFSSLATQDTASSILPVSKSELIVISLLTLLVAYLCTIFARSWVTFSSVTTLAVALSIVALGHKYALPSLGAGSDLVSTVLGPVIGITTEPNLKVLAAPNSTSQAIEILPLHTALILNEQHGGWYQATVSGGRTGWVPSEKIIIP